MPIPRPGPGQTVLAGSLLSVIIGIAGCASSANPKGPGGPVTSGGGPAADPHRASVVITAAGGCTPDRTDFQAGGITFGVTNRDATAVTEVEVLDGARIIGEKENLPPGFSGTFSVNLKAGTYTLYCPGASFERRTLTVTGTSTSAATGGVPALLKAGTTQYAIYVNDQVANLLSSAKILDGALQGTDLTTAQNAYLKARPFYEKIEPVAESFTIGTESIDADIDARANDVPASQWRGFHVIEKGLFADRSLAGLAAVGHRLVADIGRLQKLTAGLSYEPTELANGAQELLDEVAASKITGEEERYSHVDLLDIEFNVEGAQQAFAQLQPALTEIDPALTTAVNTHFAALSTLVDKYRSSSDVSGFVRYGSLGAADKRALSAAVKAVQEPLSRVASKVADK